MSQIRVLQVIGAMNRAGAETIVMNLYRAIDRDRIQFDFLVHEQDRCDYDDEIEQLGGRIFRIPRYKIANYVQYDAACRTFFNEHGRDYPVVHAHISSCASIYLKHAKRHGCSTVLHSHSLNMGHPVVVFGWKKALIEPSYRYADEFLACSMDAGLDRFGWKNTIGGHYHVMMNGIDLSRYECTDEQHEAAKSELGYEGATLVGHAGRLVEVKNHRFLIETFAQFKKLQPNAHLVLLGTGPLEDQLKLQAVDAGLSDAIHFMGSRDDVPRFLKAFDAFVFPSVKEGLPMAMIEAQAAGVPCLVSDGVPASVVAARATQRLSLEEGPEAWARHLADAIVNHPARETGAQDVREHGYDIAQTARWMEGFYLDLADRATNH